MSDFFDRFYGIDNMSRVRWELWLTTLVLVCLAGCGSGVKDRLYKVSGTVKFADGQPVTTGTIRFDSNTYNAYGQIQPDGTFTLTTLNPDDGAPAGTYRVSFGGEVMGGAGKPPQIHAKYASGTSSGLTQEVKPEANTLEITVERYVAPPPKKTEG